MIDWKCAGMFTTIVIIILQCITFFEIVHTIVFITKNRYNKKHNIFNKYSPIHYRFAYYIELFIMDAFTDMFITLCIVVNTAFMGLAHYGQSAELGRVLVNGNYVSDFL